MNRLLKENPARIIILLWYLVGIAGFLIKPLRPLFQALTPFGMIAATALLLYFHEPRSKKSWMVFAGIALFGFFAEVVGVNTQLLFGNYEYGSVLGLKLFDTPLPIGLNWLVLIYCFAALLKNRRDSWYFPVAGAAAMVVFDWIMEPVATATGMWSWCCEGITLKNYIDWFLVSGFIFLMLRILKVDINNRIAGMLILMQLIFFLGLNILIHTQLWAY